MPTPTQTPIQRAKDFAPDVSVDKASINTELDRVVNALNALIGNIADIRRDDGQLNAASTQAFSSELIALRDEAQAILDATNSAAGIAVTAIGISEANAALSEAKALASELSALAAANSSLPTNVVGNMTALRALPITGGAIATLAHHTLQGDGGGGNFEARVGAAAGTYIDDNGLVVVPVGGDGSSAWIRIKTKDISPESVGAIGDGISLDANAVNISALKDDSYLKGGSIYSLSGAELAKARASRLHGRGIIRNRGILAGVLHTDNSLFDMTGMGKSIAGATQISMLDNLPDANLNTLNDALMSGTVKVTYFGDSITENNSANGFYESSWVRNTERMLEDSFSNVAFTFDNKGIGGATSSNAIDPLFVRGVGTFGYKVKPNTFPVGLGWWTTNSVDGVSWIDQVKTTAPDLLFVGFGMNDLQAAPALFTANVEAIIAETQTWAKQPTICLVSTYLPTQIQGAPYDDSQNRANLTAHCRAMLSLAGKHKCLCLDTFRMYKFLRDGVDDRHPTMVAEFAFRNFATWWLTVTGAVSEAAGTVSSLGNYKLIRSQLQARDVVIDATITVTDVGTIPQISYRNNIGTIGNGYVVQWNGTNIQIYHNSVFLKNFAVGAIPLTTQYIRVEAIGVNHRVWLNGVLLGKLTDYKSLQSGTAGVGMTGTVASSTLKVDLRMGQERKIGRPLVSDDEIVGKFLQNDVGGWTNYSEDSEGGNALNHPTSFAQGSLYIAMFGQVIKRIVQSFERHSVNKVFRTDFTNATTTYVATGDSVSVNGNKGDKVRIDVLFPYTATVATAALELYLNGAQFSARELRFLDVTTSTYGSIMQMSLNVVLTQDGVNTFSTYATAGAGGVVSSLGSGAVGHYRRSMTVTKL